MLGRTVMLKVKIQIHALKDYDENKNGYEYSLDLLISDHLNSSPSPAAPIAFLCCCSSHNQDQNFSRTQSECISNKSEYRSSLPPPPVVPVITENPADSKKKNPTQYHQNQNAKPGVMRFNKPQEPSDFLIQNPFCFMQNRLKLS